MRTLDLGLAADRKFDVAVRWLVHGVAGWTSCPEFDDLSLFRSEVTRGNGGAETRVVGFYHMR
jgi:hypothetical protein